MNSPHKSTTSENPSAVMRSAPPSAALALCMLSAIPTCCWCGLRLRFPPSSFVSSFAMLPHNSRACSRWMPTRSGLSPQTRSPHRFNPAAKSKPLTSNVPSPLPDLFDSINCGNRSWLNPNARAGRLNSPSSALVETAPSFTTMASTVCLSPVRRGSRRGETRLPVQCRPEGLRRRSDNGSRPVPSPAGVLRLRRESSHTPKPSRVGFRAEVPRKINRDFRAVLFRALLFDFHSTGYTLLLTQTSIPIPVSLLFFVEGCSRGENVEPNYRDINEANYRGALQ